MTCPKALNMNWADCQGKLQRNVLDVYGALSGF